MRYRGSKRSFLKVQLPHGLLYPLAHVVVKLDAPFFDEQNEFPDTHRRQPQLIPRITKFLRHLRRNFPWLQVIPDPDVGVQQELHDGGATMTV
jgi:hypothetical protein